MGKRMVVMYVLVVANYIIDRGDYYFYSNDRSFIANIESNALNMSYLSHTKFSTSPIVTNYDVAGRLVKYISIYC